MAKVKFQVVLDNVELSKAQTAAIQKEINEVVARNLLKTKAKKGALPGVGTASQLVYKMPPGWIGLVIKNIKTAAELTKFQGQSIEKLVRL